MQIQLRPITYFIRVVRVNYKRASKSWYLDGVPRQLLGRLVCRRLLTAVLLYNVGVRTLRTKIIGRHRSSRLDVELLSYKIGTRKTIKRNGNEKTVETVFHTAYD